MSKQRNDIDEQAEREGQSISSMRGYTGRTPHKHSPIVKVGSAGFNATQLGREHLWNELLKNVIKEERQIKKDYFPD